MKGGIDDGPSDADLDRMLRDWDERDDEEDGGEAMEGMMGGVDLEAIARAAAEGAGAGFGGPVASAASRAPGSGGGGSGGAVLAAESRLIDAMGGDEAVTSAGGVDGSVDVESSALESQLLESLFRPTGGAGGASGRSASAVRRPSAGGVGPSDGVVSDREGPVGKTGGSGSSGTEGSDEEDEDGLFAFENALDALLPPSAPAPEEGASGSQGDLSRPSSRSASRGATGTLGGGGGGSTSGGGGTASFLSRIQAAVQAGAGSAELQLLIDLEVASSSQSSDQGDSDGIDFEDGPAMQVVLFRFPRRLLKPCCP